MNSEEVDQKIAKLKDLARTEGLTECNCQNKANLSKIQDARNCSYTMHVCIIGALSILAILDIIYTEYKYDKELKKCNAADTLVHS